MQTKITDGENADKNHRWRETQEHNLCLSHRKTIIAFIFTDVKGKLLSQWLELPQAQNLRTQRSLDFN